MTDNILKPSKIASFTYALFVHSTTLKLKSKFFKKVWEFFWGKSLDIFSGAVTTDLHGIRAIVNYGYTYPLIVREYRSYNAPLIELTHRVYENKSKKITIIDIGAAVGDTMLCLLANCPEMIDKFYCIDGDDIFFQYLTHNLASFKNGRAIKSFLAASEGEEKSLVKIHRGTASAQGSETSHATTLDAIMQREKIEQADILKIDVDGFDGKILAGSMATLNTYKPAIFFEWHPLLCKQVNSNWMEHFMVLGNCGYDKFIWFDNCGGFSHFTIGSDFRNIEILAHLLNDNKLPSVVYYDIIALHKNSTLSLDHLAELAHAQSRRSWT